MTGGRRTGRQTKKWEVNICKWAGPCFAQSQSTVTTVVDGRWLSKCYLWCLYNHPTSDYENDDGGDHHHHHHRERYKIFGSIRLGLQNTLKASLLRGKIPSRPVSQDMSLTIWWWGFNNAGALWNAEYPFIATALRSTLAQSGSWW